MLNLNKYFSTEGVQSLGATFTKVHQRFPLTLISSLFGTFSMIYFLEKDGNDYEIGKVVATMALAVSLMFSIEIFNERKLFNKWIPIIFGILFLASYWYFLEIENQYKEFRKFQIRFAVLAIVFHLLVSVAPYIKKGNIESFWNYNKTLFLSILNAFLYSLTLSGGLCLAILAIDKLFDINVNNEWYRNIFFFVNGYCNTIFFLAKLPSLNLIDSKTDSYPLGLKYFTQYVLLPLVAIYLLILLAYEFKIIVNWSLPKGWVSVLVMASAIFGILAFLLLYPLRSSNKWIAKFTKVYYWILIPLIVLMMVAIFVRIKEYGVTEPRYFIAIVSVWLLGICLYFSFSKIDNIKLIPISLIVIGLFTVYGPFNAFFASRFNQEKRMLSVLNNNKMLENGKIVVPKDLELDINTRQKLDASIDYFTRNNLEVLQNYVSTIQFDSLAKSDSYGRKSRFLNMLKLQKNVAIAGKLKNYYRKQTEVDSLKKADYLIFVDNYNERALNIEGSKFDMKVNKLKKDKTYSILLDGELIVFDFGSLLKENFENNQSNENMTFLKDSKKWKLRLVLDSINFTEEENIENFSGKLYLTKL